MLALTEWGPPRARPVLLKCMEVADQTGAPHAIAYVSSLLGMLALSEGDMAEAARRFRTGLSQAHAVRDPFITSYALVGRAAAASAKGEMERAAPLFGAAERLRAMIGSPVLNAQQDARIVNADAVRASLGAERFAALTAAARATPLDEVVAAELAAGPEAH